MKIKFSKLIVVLVICLNSIFTAAALYAFIIVGSEPVALIAAWFSFTTGELWMLSYIKNTKVKRRYLNEDKLETEANK